MYTHLLIPFMCMQTKLCLFNRTETSYIKISALSLYWNLNAIVLLHTSSIMLRDNQHKCMQRAYLVRLDICIMEGSSASRGLFHTRMVDSFQILVLARPLDICFGGFFLVCLKLNNLLKDASLLAKTI